LIKTSLFGVPFYFKIHKLLILKTMKKTTKIMLSEKEMPRQWYNIVADMPNKPMPPLHPLTREPIGPDALSPVFPMELIKQEVSAERYIDIPDEVLDMYKHFVPLPFTGLPTWKKRLVPKARSTTSMREEIIPDRIKPILP
jgi:predicted alternative tryptophan synthase beta-subunit